MFMYVSGAYVAPSIMYPAKNMRQFTNGPLADSASTYLCEWMQTCLPDKWFHVAHFLGAFAKLRKATISFVMSIRPSVLPSACNNSAPTRRIFVKFDI